MANRSKRNAAAEVTRLATEIRSEIRRIIRKWYGLKTPLQHFREVDRPEGLPNKQVLFGPSLLGDSPPKPGSAGLHYKGNEFGFPDERINDAFHDFAGSVWHLGDRINMLDRVRGTPAVLVKKRLRENENDSRNLLICGDLITQKKHGARTECSGLHPWLSNTHYDTSNSGEIELWYDGKVKETVLLVSNDNPVPFHVDIYSSESPSSNHDPPYDDNAKIGNAVDIISSGFHQRLTLIRDLKILDNDGPEDKAIIQILMPFCDLRTVSE